MAAPAPHASTDTRYKDDKSPAKTKPDKAGRGDVTILLQRLADGDRSVEHELYELVYLDLKKCAHNVRRRFLRINDIQTTELIGSVYLRLSREGADQNRRNKQHFIAYFARYMHWYLLDYVRKWSRVKFDPLDGLEDILAAPPGYNPQLAILIHELLKKLNEENPLWVSLVEMKYFAGFTNEETAAAMGVSVSTMEKMWLEARKWLFDRLGRRNDKQGPRR